MDDETFIQMVQLQEDIVKAFRTSKTEQDRWYWQGVKDGYRKYDILVRPESEQINNFLLQSSYLGGKLTPTEAKLEKAKEFLNELSNKLFDGKRITYQEIDQFIRNEIGD